MMHMRSRSAVWAALVPVVTLLACVDRNGSDGAVAGEPQYGGTVVIAGPTDFDYLNGLVTADAYTQEMLVNALFLPLIRYTANLDYEAALAERWEMIADTAVIFHLRRDVRWHDGRPTTAHDVIFTYQRATDPETAYPNAYYFSQFTGASAPDSFTVQFTFTPHEYPLASLPYVPIMPAHALDSIPSARLRQAAFNRRPIGNGPFRFVENRGGDRWIFEANPDFPEALGGRPYLDRLVWRVIGETTAQLVELRTGSVDLILSAQPDAYERVAREPGIEASRRATTNNANVMWNGRHAPLDNPQVRKALTMAIDRQQIVDLARAGFGELAVGPIGPHHWSYDDAVAPLPFDPDSARALLDAAGLQDRDGDGIREDSDGRPFAIELKYASASVTSRDIAEFTRGNLASVGVRITLRGLDYNTMIQDVSSPERNFQGVIVAFGGDFEPNLRDSFHSAALGGTYQAASYSNPRVDTLIDQVHAARDRDSATRIYQEIQQIMRDEQPWTFLYYMQDLILRRDRLRNVEMDIRGLFTNVDRWWVTNPRPAALSPDGSADHSPDPDSVPAR